MTDTIVAGFISAGTCLVGALIGGGLTILSTIKAVDRTSHGLELDEVRRQRILCITALNGTRWVLGDNQALPEFKAQFISELNKIPVLWSGDPTVLKNVRDFFAERSNDLLIRLLRSLGDSGLTIDNLGDSDFRNVFRLR